MGLEVDEFWVIKALSPQMIIFWVTTGRSWTERGKSVGVYGEKSTRLSQPIAFSSSPVRSESLVEEECGSSYSRAGGGYDAERGDKRMEI